MASAQPTYVYGVRKSSAGAISTAGIGGAKLRQIESDGVAAIVSDLPPDTELRFGREELTTHARVLERALAAGTVLPMRFGVVLESPEAVQSNVLEAHRDELREQLEQFEGKVELRLRAIYDEQQLMREVVSEDREIGRLREVIRGKPAEATYFERIRLGELVGEAVERKRESDTNQILPQLEQLAEAIDVGEPTHERMVFGASFLVDRERIAQFDKAVDEVGRRQADRMRLTYTGPLPPHSFAELKTQTS
ncbi:MAG: GvpL/GvpF family gas vesicle protein [Solirubrobacterales bacterium]|nr:GvpL/GvpF family gas vesicle protein [Solirubrobacterales bacterium]